MSDDQPNLMLELLRGIRAMQAEHTAELVAIRRRLLAIEFGLTRIRRENVGDADAAMTAIMDHDVRLAQLEQRVQLNEP